MSATVAGIHLGLDTHANRPAANAVPVGSIYSCSTHSLFYKTDGSTWATYATLGGTAVTDATISVSDVTTNNASTSAHGWLKKLDGNAAHFMDGTGAWSTPGGTGGATMSRLGKTTVGASTLAGANVGIAKKITLSATSLLVSINTHIDMNSDAHVNPWAAVYDDVTGTPTHILATTHGANAGNTGGPNLYLETAGGSGFSARWMAFPIGLYLAAGDYWIVTQFDGNGSPRFYYDTGGSDKTISYSGFGWGDASRINTQGTSTRDHSTYAVILS
jgi:hypothetical protein